MNKLSKFLFLLTAGLSIAFVSCKKEGSSENFAVSYGVVMGEQAPFSIQTDGGNTLVVVENQIPAFTLENGMRVRINFSLLSEVAKDKYNVRLNAVEKILTKEPVYSTKLTPEELTALGNNPINVEDAWFGGNYLNVNFIVYRDDLNKKHFINLLVDEAASTADNVVVILKHNAYDDPARVPAFGRVSFNLAGLVHPGATSVKVTLKWTTYGGAELSDSGVFYLNTGESSGSLVGSASGGNSTELGLFQ